MALCIWTAIQQVKSASSEHDSGQPFHTKISEVNALQHITPHGKQKACIISEVPYGKQYLRLKILQCQLEREGQSDPTTGVKIKAESLKIQHLQQDFSQNKQDPKAKSVSSRKIRDKETGM
ncbi:hypothetical protein EDD18DRAFT_1100998 [Armillaria luteobubalina]|uniref:Uncharacterized protein n=1 Tax=Armillaria luteobubalina TaxID=153913 RepID=A0AA39TWT7_9AGAR|nr:hypothetical protein EDD18DRAFT_1100998 [Armillaria luteobubalina]